MFKYYLDLMFQNAKRTILGPFSVHVRGLYSLWMEQNAKNMIL
jgi:hypothetical protein